MYQTVDPRAMNLLLKLLDKDPSSRITACEALQHSYFHHEQIYQMPRYEKMIDEN